MDNSCDFLHHFAQYLMGLCLLGLIKCEGGGGVMMKYLKNVKNCHAGMILSNKKKTGK